MFERVLTAMTPAAGILLCTRDHHERDHVVLGRRQASRSRVKRALKLHGWAIPFGALDASDQGDFARCAVRETAQELLGLGESESYERCRRVLADELRLSAQDLDAALHADGRRVSRYRTFLLRVPFREDLLERRYAGNWEFPDGLRWYRYVSPSEIRDGDVRLEQPWHRALLGNFDRLHRLITQSV